jgi:hypothetical protein
MTSHLHSPAHVEEVCWQAVRRALGITMPVSRDTSGRYVSRKETKSRELREEMLAAAIESTRPKAAIRREGRG